MFYNTYIEHDKDKEGMKGRGSTCLEDRALR